VAFVDRFQGIFGRLAWKLREAQRVHEENETLREENRQLRHALADCVENCGDFLAPVLDDPRDDAEEEDRAAARRSLGEARQLLARLGGTRRLTA
jgi:hypothetical protein